ncbi:MAG: PTS sugar transporter subunit IIA [Rectinemataceae bacterium]|jgi:PTS system fructose-specific IIC component/PTS system nitrogen regulatory IIA component
MLLQRVFAPGSIKIGLESEDKDELFEELVDMLAKEGGRGFPRASVLAAIREREDKMSTGIKKGIAVPHGKAEGLSGLTGALGISKRGIEYSSLDGEPVYLVFMLVSDPKDSELHLAALKRLAVLLDDPEFYTDLSRADSPERANAIIRNYESRLVDLNH